MSKLEAIILIPGLENAGEKAILGRLERGLMNLTEGSTSYHRNEVTELEYSSILCNDKQLHLFELYWADLRKDV